MLCLFICFFLIYLLQTFNCNDTFKREKEEEERQGERERERQQEQKQERKRETHTQSKIQPSNELLIVITIIIIAGYIETCELEMPQVMPAYIELLAMGTCAQVRVYVYAR